MENLSPGVLLNLLEQKTSNKTPSLLQIRSIVPILSETENNDDLFPKHGFYLKVADSSHAMYVSLPREQQDMVLGDQLQLGQLIFVERIEKDDSSVPVLQGIRPVPGRHACVGNPEDIIVTDSIASLELGGVLKKPSKMCFSPLQGSMKNRRVSLPLLSTPLSDRRSWNNGSEVSSSCSVSEAGTKPILRKKNACVSASSNLSLAYDRLSDNSSSVTKKTSKPVNEIVNKPMQNCDKHLDQSVKSSPVNDDKELAESKTLSHSLSKNLVKLGKEVEKSRDLALLASVEALQEASMSERLLRCLDEFSKLKSSKEQENPPSLANMFFKLQQDLAQTGLFLQSLTSSDQNSKKCSRKSTTKLFADRNKVANSWINAALASDLDPLFMPSLPTEDTNLASRLSTNRGRKMDYKNSINNSEHWVKGSAFSASLELTNSLQYESKLWFLSYAEKYLDDLLNSNKTGSEECSDSEVAEMMSQITKVGDWLDSNDVVILAIKDSEVVESCRRLRNKIYRVLLKMADRTALAWGHKKTMVEEVKQ